MRETGDKTATKWHLSPISTHDLEKNLAVRMVVPHKKQKTWNISTKLGMHQPSLINLDSPKLGPKSHIDHSNSHSSSKDRQESTGEKSIGNNSMKERMEVKHGRKNLERNCFQNIPVKMNTNDDVKRVGSSARLGFPTIHKAKSSDNVTSKTTKIFEQEGRQRIGRFIEAEVSPLVNRKLMRTVSDRRVVPRLPSLVQRTRETSKSLQELTVKQKITIQQILKENHPSYALDDAFWSKHWLRTRNQLLQNGRTQYLHSESAGARDAVTIKVNGRTTPDQIQFDREDSLIRVATELSLEDRLLLIETMHGLTHA